MEQELQRKIFETLKTFLDPNTYADGESYNTYN